MRPLKDYSFATKINIAGKETTIHQTVTNVFQGSTNQDQALQSSDTLINHLLKQTEQALNKGE